MSDVELTPVEWLWKPYLPFGKLSVLQGNPGEGKTYFAMHLAAACTNGKLLPNMERMEPFNVIYQTAEDGLGDTVKPRLIEAGADLDRVLVIDDSEVQLTLSDERIEKAIIENNARLVIIDPIQAYLGADVDMNRANEVRPIFMRLGQVAQRTGCAILLIGHLNKAAGMQSLQRGLGSIDIAAAVRSVMFIGKLKHDPTMRILTHEKSSLAPPGVSLAFSLGDEGGFRWVGEYDITADEMLSGIEPQRETKTQQAKDLICALLAGGKQVLSEDIDKAALERGIPGRTVRDTENKKAELFSKVRSGQVRVLLGSTAKMGAGTNVQTLLVAVHHLDVGWRPSDMTQRNGRIIRQGNQNKQVYVYNYVTESTFDAYLYQTLENKQKFISQIMTSKSPMRSCDDIDEQALSYAEIKALCAGDPRIREKMDLDVQVAKLKVLRGDFQNQKYRLEDKLLKTFPEEIQKQKTRIAALQQDSQIAAAHPQDKENFCGMTIKGMVYDDKKAAGERLLLARQEMPNADMMLLGTYRGFELNIRFDSFKNEHQAVLRAELSYPVSLGDDARGNITRLDNAIDNFADRIADAENALQNLEQQKQAAEVEVAKPFAQEEELAEKSARLAELNALLNIDRDRSSSQDAPEETDETEAPATRPSVLAALGEKTNQPEPVKPFRSYYDKDGDAR